jgi:hypothetical protein
MRILSLGGRVRVGFRDALRSFLASTPTIPTWMQRRGFVVERPWA